MKGYAEKTILEKRSGKIHRIYTYDGKPCRRFELTGKVVNQLRGYLLIEKDLRNVISWLEQLDEEMRAASLGSQRGEKLWMTNPDRRQGLQNKALFVAALTFYAKGYTKCDGRPVKMEREQLDAKFRVLHDECMRFRHNFAAHSGRDRIEYVQTVLVLPQKSKRPVMPQIFKELLQPEVALPMDGELEMLDLCQHAKTVIQKKIDSLLQKVLKDEVLSKGWDHWYQMPRRA